MLHFVQPQCEIRTISLSEPLKTHGVSRRSFCLLNTIYTRETFGVLPLFKHLHNYLKCRAIITFSQLQGCDDMFTTSSARLSSPTALMQIKISVGRANFKGSATTSHQHQGENMRLSAYLYCNFYSVNLKDSWVSKYDRVCLENSTGENPCSNSCLSKANKYDMPIFSFPLFKKIKVTFKLSWN